MKKPLFEKLAIVGVGLLGGSIGLKARGDNLVEHVIGIGRREESLQKAQDAGAIDEFTLDLKSGVKDADLVILATPVCHIVSILPDVMRSAKRGALVTDVGSTKVSIVNAAEAASTENGALFVGSHPMAGSEKSGVEFSRPDLFEGTTCFLTPTPRTSLQAFASISQWWRALGCRLAVARPERHDALVALISHLPHLVAVALVRAVESFKEDQNLIKGIIGNGFRDTTRIAEASAEMWQDICADNSAEIRKAAAAFMESLSSLLSAHDGDLSQLEAAFLAACEYRKSLDER